MPILNKPNQKSKYVLSLIDGKEYCKTNGRFNIHLKQHNLTEEDYVINYENGIKLICCACERPLQFDQSTWNWDPVCHSRGCANSKWQNRQSCGPDHGKKSHAWRADKEKAAKVNQQIHAANQRVGEDGLTGYQRTKMKREQILLERTGCKYPTGQWSTADTEKRKWQGAQIKAGVMRKYGVEYVMQVPQILEKQKNTLNRPEERARRSAQMIEQLKTMQLSYSKISQVLFDELNKDIDFAESQYATKSGEKKIGYYSADFCYKNKIIEFNGDYWHANPTIYCEDQEFIRGSGKATASAIWDFDAKRIAFMEAKGYKVKIVWESDFRNNPEYVIKECIEWLKM